MTSPQEVIQPDVEGRAVGLLQVEQVGLKGSVGAVSADDETLVAEGVLTVELTVLGHDQIPIGLLGGHHHEEPVREVRVGLVERLEDRRVVLESPIDDRGGLPKHVTLCAARGVEFPEIPIGCPCRNPPDIGEIDRHGSGVVEHAESSVIAVDEASQEGRKPGSTHASRARTCEQDSAGARKGCLGEIHTRRKVAQTAMETNRAEWEARVHDIVVPGEDRAIAIGRVDDRVVADRIRDDFAARVKAGAPDALRRRWRGLVFGQNVAEVETLPTGTTALQQDHEFLGASFLGVCREGRSLDADRTVAPVWIEGVFGPTVADVYRGDWRELAQIFVDSGSCEFCPGRFLESKFAPGTHQDDCSQQQANYRKYLSTRSYEHAYPSPVFG